MTDIEPPKPVRGRTADEQGRDVSPEQAEAEKLSGWQGFVAIIKPGVVISQADGYPVGLKQFLQFCLVLIYPAWVFAAVAGYAAYGLIYAILWPVFWPVRRWMKKNRPEEYAETMARHGKKG